MSIDAKVWISTADVEELLIGVYELAKSFGDGPYSMTTDGVTSETAQYSPEQNAYNFVVSYYGLTAGAFRLIAGSMGIVTSAIVGGGLSIEAEDLTVTPSAAGTVREQMQAILADK